MEIHTITTPFVLNTSVNCYLVRTSDGFVLIDTGVTNRRGLIEKELENQGCQSGKLALIILTHGDFDHSGNALYLRNKYKSQIIMHKNDSGMVEHGDMLWNRNKKNLLIRTMFKLFKLRDADRFQPDVSVDEGYDFSKYGFDAKVLELPGHSKGSIGILTAGGDLFCGDLLENTNNPKKNTLVDDSDALDASVEKLTQFNINKVYPGHGQPFPMDQFLKNH